MIPFGMTNSEFPDAQLEIQCGQQEPMVSPVNQRKLKFAQSADYFPNEPQPTTLKSSPVKQVFVNDTRNSTGEDSVSIKSEKPFADLTEYVTRTGFAASMHFNTKSVMLADGFKFVHDSGDNLLYSDFLHDAITGLGMFEPFANITL